MSTNNFNNFDNEFNIDMFSTEDQRYGVEDDNLLLSDPELEEQLNGSSADNNVNNEQKMPKRLKRNPVNLRRRRRSDEETRMISSNLPLLAIQT
jgi:hypothetical protein